MKTSLQISLNFQAKLIEQTQAKKLVYPEKDYQSVNLSFVEIEPANKRDINALREVAENWDCATFATDIYTTARALSRKSLDSESYKIYALSSQRQNFDQLISDDILGIAEFKKDGANTGNLNFLQVDPDLIMSYDKPRYKYIGTGILNSLKSLYSKAITLTSVYSAALFYEKNGFKLIKPENLLYKWKSLK